MKRQFLKPFVILLLGFLVACGGDEEPTNTTVNADISGEFEGRITAVDGFGIVLYRFVLRSDNVYTGYYNGVEFGEVTVNENVLTGIPTNGNTSFSTMNGNFTGDRISLVFFNSQGSAVATFGGNLVVDGSYTTADITINGDEYAKRTDSSDPSICNNGALDYSVITSYIRVGNIGLYYPTIYLNFQNQPADGTYAYSANRPSGSTFNGDFSYNGEFYDFNGGSVTVFATADGFNVSLDNASVAGLNVSGNAICD